MKTEETTPAQDTIALAPRSMPLPAPAPVTVDTVAPAVDTIKYQ